MGPVGGRTFPAAPRGGLGPLRQRRHRRAGRPRPRGGVAADSRVRLGLEPAGHGRFVGAVPERPVDLAGPVGLDLDLVRPVGMGALPLRQLGEPAGPVVLGPDSPLGRVGALRPGAGRLHGRRARRAGGRLRGVVPARPAGPVRSLVGAAPLGPRRQRHVRQPALRDRRGPRRLRRRALRRPRDRPRSASGPPGDDRTGSPRPAPLPSGLRFDSRSGEGRRRPGGSPAQRLRGARGGHATGSSSRAAHLPEEAGPDPGERRQAGRPGRRRAARGPGAAPAAGRERPSGRPGRGQGAPRPQAGTGRDAPRPAGDRPPGPDPLDGREAVHRRSGRRLTPVRPAGDPAAAAADRAASS